VAQKPAGMTLAVHLCRGNFKSTHAAEGGYEPVAEALLAEMKVDAYFLEYDDERSGDFRPLRFLPKDKVVVLGLITTKLGALESKDAIKRRIDEAAKYVPLDQLALSPQCGFSSSFHGNDIEISQQTAKLQLVVDVRGKSGADTSTPRPHFRHHSAMPITEMQHYMVCPGTWKRPGTSTVRCSGCAPDRVHRSISMATGSMSATWPSCTSRARRVTRKPAGSRRGRRAPWQWQRRLTSPLPPTTTTN
jgi:hypothetical protein